MKRMLPGDNRKKNQRLQMVPPHVVPKTAVPQLQAFLKAKHAFHVPGTRHAASVVIALADGKPLTIAASPRAGPSTGRSVYHRKVSPPLLHVQPAQLLCEEERLRASRSAQDGVAWSQVNSALPLPKRGRRASSATSRRRP